MWLGLGDEGGNQQNFQILLLFHFISNIFQSQLEQSAPATHNPLGYLRSVGVPLEQHMSLALLPPDTHYPLLGAEGVGAGSSIDTSAVGGFFFFF